jgi:general secretion pathway protein K
VKGKHSQQGAAILLAMLVVTLVATLAAGLQWRQWRAYSQEAAIRTQSQASWVLVGALDWARLILREDARSDVNAPIDHLGEPWALPLQEAKLSSFLSADSLAEAGQDEAYLSGRITDAQSKINLTQLVEGGKLSQAALAKLYRLYLQLNLPPNELKNWTSQWLRSQPSLGNTSTNASAESQAAEPLLPQFVQDLHWLGVPQSSIRLLEPYITILPQNTPINLNTASALVIYASMPDIELAQAVRWVAIRGQAPFHNLNEAAKQFSIASENLNKADFSVTSNYFEVNGRLRLGTFSIEENSLVQRASQDVKALWRRRGL